MNKFLTLPVLSILIGGCTSQPSDSYFESIQELNPRKESFTVHPVDALIGNPGSIYIKDSLLILCDVVDDKVLLLYDLKNKTEIGRFIHTGNGPEDVLLPVFMQAAGDKIGLLQRQTGNYRTYSIDSLMSGSAKFLTSTDISGGADVAWMTDNGFISGNYYPGGSLQFSDKNGHAIGNFDINPEYLSSAPSFMDRYRIGQGKIGYNPSTNRLLFASLFTGYINTYSWENGALSLINSIAIGSKKIENRIRQFGDFSIKNNDLEHSRQVWVSGNWFYVLYSGMPMNNRNGDKSSSYIIKIDNEGQVDQVWRFDIRLACFCISEDRTLWGIGLSDDYEYELIQATI